MRKTWIIGLSAAWMSWAQTAAPSPEQVENAIEATMRGAREQRQTAYGSWGADRLRPTGESVSLLQLQHRVPKEARKAFGRAEKRSKAGNHEHAANDLETAVSDDPEFAAAWGELGAEYGQLERWAEAEAALRRSLALDANPWSVHYNLAVVQSRRGNLSGAQQSARLALDRAPNDARVHWLLGFLLYQSPKTEAEGLQHVKSAAPWLKEARKFLRAAQPR